MKNTLNKNSALFLSITLLLSLLMSYQLYLATSWGAGLSTDSLTYLEGAKKISANWSIKDIGTHYPPLYFILIAITELITEDTIVAMKWLQIAIIAINCFLFTLIVWKGTHKALIPTFTGSLLFITSQHVLIIHIMAWSEASFCFFALFGIYFLANYLEHDKSHATLALSSICIGMAFLTRYAGLTLVITGIITLILTHSNWKKRIIDSLYFGIISILPMLLWMSGNLMMNNEATSRHFVLHPISIEKIQTGIQVLLKFLYISDNTPFLLLAFFILFIVLYAITKKNTVSYTLNKTPEICFLFIVTYISFLLVSISFFDAHTPLDIRILFPAYLFFMIGLSIFNYRVYITPGLRPMSYLIAFLMFLLIYIQFGHQQRYLFYAATNGIGFASKKWSQSDILQWVKKMPPTTIIYTNGPDPIKHLADRQSKMIPKLLSPVDRKKNKKFKQEFQYMRSRLSEADGVIVYFDRIKWRWYLPTFDQIRETLPLQIIYKGRDGVVAQIKKAE